MTGHDSFGLLPTYIPQDVDMTVVKAQVAADGVSAPPAAVPGLLDVVNQAHAEGIDLKIVLLDHNPPNDTPLRDISTVVGADYPGATVLTLSPSYVGSYSTQFPRVTLEAGEDHSKTGNPVVSAQNFLHALETPEFPWTGLTIVLLVGVLAAAVGTRFLQLRGRRAATSSVAADASAAEPAEGS
ncbi:Rv1476 family membrane protein [Mycobacterium sp. HUMS_1102779]|uniref:Rv1476 family membrane protein n=1 Tax=Mycobacterium sp. HUMS_1102779 TaxID=3383487 RepID=UPI00389AE363